MKWLLVVLLMSEVTIGGIRWKTDYAEARGLKRWMWVHFGENPG